MYHFRKADGIPSSRRPARPHRATNWHHFSRLRASVLLSAVVLLVAACGARVAGSGSTATPLATATATATPGPVVLGVSVVQQGTVAQHNVKLIVSLQISNTTDQPLHLVQTPCTWGLGLPVLIEVDDASGHAVWQSPLYGFHCIMQEGPPGVIQTVAAHASITWAITSDLSKPSAPYGYPALSTYHLYAGAKYVVKAQLAGWYQGTMNDASTPTGPSDWNMIGQTTIVLQ